MNLCKQQNSVSTNNISTQNVTEGTESTVKDIAAEPTVTHVNIVNFFRESLEESYSLDIHRAYEQLPYRIASNKRRGRSCNF